MTNTNDQSAMAKVVYILFLVSLLTGGLTAIVGVVLAHVYHEGAEQPLKSHFEYQYRTFWIGLLYSVVCIVTTPILIGGLLWVALLIWVIVRCAKGLRALGEGRAVENVTSWWV